MAHLDWPQSTGRCCLEFVGWDARGPFGTFPSTLGTQGGRIGRWYGPVVRVTSGGQPAAALGGPACGAVDDVAPDGTTLCESGSGIQVRNADGAVIWSSRTGGFFGFLSPDRSSAVIWSDQPVSNGGQPVCCYPTVLDRTGSSTLLSQKFSHQGWLSQDMLIGWSQWPEMAFVRLDAPDQVVDLGFKGEFVGLVRA
jgi:hypothetical protein